VDFSSLAGGTVDLYMEQEILHNSCIQHQQDISNLYILKVFVYFNLSCQTINERQDYLFFSLKSYHEEQQGHLA
jgi:hypothetical protein